MAKNQPASSSPLLPPVHRGMLDLDRSKFTTLLNVMAIKVPASSCSRYIRLLQSFELDYPRLRRVLTPEDEKDTRLLLLRPSVVDIECLPDEIQRELESDKISVLKNYQYPVNYDYFNAEQILDAVLPENVDFGSSFETIGHIIHLNLRDEMQPYKNLIGQVLLDKLSPTIQTVVTKVGEIHNVFRTFDMEVIAGNPDFVTEMRENGCRFELDFSKVYWNSRLHAEHERLIHMFKKTDRVCDVFAGIGPFAIPAAKKGCIVYANDLNPNSFEYLGKNIAKNKVTKNVRAYNMDGREFIRQASNDLRQSIGGDGIPVFDHFVMNLPATALEFLDAFVGLYHGLDVEEKDLPMIHCHCFTREREEKRDDGVIQRASQRLGGAKITDAKAYYVRKVAPNKDMMCISFRLPREAAFNAKRKPTEANDDDQEAK